MCEVEEAERSVHDGPRVNRGDLFAQRHGIRNDELSVNPTLPTLAVHLPTNSSKRANRLTQFAVEPRNR